MDNFPSQNLTGQYISRSYHGIIQKYFHTDDKMHFLDGVGTDMFSIPSSSIGKDLSVFTGSTESASIAEHALTSSVSLDSISSSYSFNATTASHVNGGIFTDVIQFNTSSDSPVWGEGKLFWDKNAHTLTLYNEESDVSLQIGQEQMLRVVAGETLYNGAAVRLSGSIMFNGVGLPIGFLAIADGTETKSQVLGLSTHDINSGSTGYVTINGQVHDVDTSAYDEGTVLYLSHTDSGSLQSVPTPEPHENIVVGQVLISDSTTGSIVVNVLPVANFPRLSSGATVIPQFIDNGDGTFTVGSGSANFFTDLEGKTRIKNYMISGSSFTSSLNVATYVYYDYNSGNPQISITDTPANINGYTQVGILTLFNYANTIYSIDLDKPGLALSNKLLRRFIFTDRFKRQSGLMLGVSGSRYVTISSGVVWYGVNNNQLNEFNSSTGKMLQFYHSASVWTSSIVTQWNNTQYDDGVELKTMGGGKFNTHYIYRTVGDDTAMLIVGSYNDNLGISQNSEPPSNLPQFISTHGILVGRIIFVKDAITPTQIDSAFVTTFTPSPTTLHNDLTSIQGGSTNNYYHLTGTEYTGSFGTGSFLRTSGSVVSNLKWNFRRVSSSIVTVTYSDYTLLCQSTASSPQIINLPSSSLTSGMVYNIKHISGSSSVQIQSVDSSSLIDFQRTRSLDTSGSMLTVQSDGTQYWVI